MLLILDRIEVADLVTQAGNVKEILSINFEKISNSFFHAIIIMLCDDDTIWEIDIPKIKMDEITIITETIKNQSSFFNTIFSKTVHVNLGNGIVFPIDNVFFTLKDITKYKEVTIREIEKELGYKIKIKNN